MYLLEKRHCTSHFPSVLVYFQPFISHSHPSPGGLASAATANFNGPTTSDGPEEAFHGVYFTRARSFLAIFVNSSPKTVKSRSLHKILTLVSYVRYSLGRQ